MQGSSGGGLPAIALRHQRNVLRRKRPESLVFSNADRLLFVWLYRLAPGILNALSVVEPATVISWHRRGFRAFWRWKSKSPAGRPKTPLNIRTLIRDMSAVSPSWGTPRIHGELLKLGIDIGQTTVASSVGTGAPPTRRASSSALIPKWLTPPCCQNSLPANITDPFLLCLGFRTVAVEIHAIRFKECGLI